MKSRSVFVICRKDDSPYSFYSTHGSVCGVGDAVGYGTLKDAKKFLSCEETQSYIDHELPEWARELHHPVEVHSWDLIFTVPELAILLRHCKLEIPSHLLEPAPDRLLVWRR